MSTTSTHPCPAGCGRPVPYNQFACQPDWLRLPFALRKAISANYRRDAQAHTEAMRNAGHWYRAHPTTNDLPPAEMSVSDQLRDMADVLKGTGRHIDHDRRQAGRCVVCECGVRVQGQMVPRPAEDSLPLFDVSTDEGRNG